MKKQSEYKKQICFENEDREHWLRTISEFRSGEILSNVKDEVYQLIFNKKINKDTIQPFHIVLLSCLIDYIKSKGYLIQLSFDNKELRDFLFDEVSIKSYWGKEAVTHVESPQITDLNLWRIVDKEKDFYSIRIHDYLKETHFSGYDLSALKVVLNELYFNVSDHAKASGNAFSYISYNKKEKKIQVAVCDFGKGIAKSLLDEHPEYETDDKALEYSIEKGVSARTQKHNRGLGLDDIVSILANNNELRIVSNNALLYVEGYKETVKSRLNDFEFQGTLIYFDISIDIFVEDDETIDFEF